MTIPDPIDAALALPTFTDQYKAMKALVHAAGNDWREFLNDERIEAWHGKHVVEMHEIMMMNLEAMVNESES